MVRGAGRDAHGRRGSRRDHVAPLSGLTRRFRPVARALVEHDLPTYAAALAYRVLVGLVPLTLLSLGLLAALGRRDVWDETLGPALRDRLTSPFYTGIDFSVDLIFASSSAGLIALASALLAWQLLRAVRTATKALNRIFGCEETRDWKKLVVLDVGLALVLGLCLVGSVVVVAIVPRLVDGWLRAGAAVLAWAIAAVFLWFAVRALVRWAPSTPPSATGASVGSAVVVGGWVLASIGFGWWAGSVANYKTAVGTLAVFLVLTAYVFTVSMVFLVGIELDELARREREDD